MNNKRLQAYLAARELGLKEQGWILAAQQHRLKSLGLSRTRLFSTSHQAGSVTCLDLDPTEQRYLLCGAADATVSIYDTHALGNTRGGLPLEPLCSAGRSLPGGHHYLVSSVAWYPMDTGMFITGSYDHNVKCWDANMMEVVCSFGLPAKVAAVAMSQVATSHCLIATGCHDPSLRLCDPASGAFTHTLVGHRDPIWSVAWSYRSEYELVSGDTRGQVRVWDIRRFGALHILDHYATTPVRVRRQQQLQLQQAHARASTRISPHDSMPQPPEGSLGRSMSAGSSDARRHSASGVGASEEDAVEAAWANLALHTSKQGTGSKPTSRSKRPSLDLPLAKPSKRPSLDLPLAKPSKRPSLELGSPAWQPRQLEGNAGRSQGPAPVPGQLQRSRWPWVGGAQARSSSASGLCAANAGAAVHSPVRDQQQHQQQQQQQRHRQQEQREQVEQRQLQRYWALLSSSGSSQNVGPLAPLPLQAHQRGSASRGLIGGHAPPARALLQQEARGGTAGLQEELMRSHQGAVTSVTPTPDGLHWLTSGTDDRLRLWDALDWHHLLVAYPGIRNRAIRGKQCAVTTDGRVVFHPCGSSVQVFEVSTGRLLAHLQGGHIDAVSAVAWNPSLEELYSGGNDGQIMVWTPGQRHGATAPGAPSPGLQPGG